MDLEVLDLDFEEIEDFVLVGVGEVADAHLKLNIGTLEELHVFLDFFDFEG